MSGSGFVAVLVIHLHFSDAGSLKSKRQRLSSIKAGLHRRLGASVSEVDHQDLWQRTTLIAALTGGSAGKLEDAIERMTWWLEERCPEGVRVEHVLASVAELRDLLPLAAGEE